MDKRSMQIARVLFWDALILLSLSAYEFISRLDGMIGPLKMFVNMAVGEKIPLERVIRYVDVTIFEAPLFLLLCFIAGVIALFSRRSRRGSAVLLVPATALVIWGFSLRLTLFGNLIQIFKLLPLVLLLLLSLARAVTVPKTSSKAPPRPVPSAAYPDQFPIVRQRRNERHHRRRAS